MSLRIRLRRMGRRNAPTYRIVVAESAMPRDGRIVENIGHYNPRTEPLTLAVDRSRALHWIEHGATPSDTVKALLKKAGVFGPEELVEEEPVVAAAVEEVSEGEAEAPVAEEASAPVAEGAGEPEGAEEAAEPKG